MGYCEEIGFRHSVVHAGLIMTVFERVQPPEKDNGYPVSK